MRLKIVVILSKRITQLSTVR